MYGEKAIPNKYFTKGGYSFRRFNCNRALIHTVDTEKACLPILSLVLGTNMQTYVPWWPSLRRHLPGSVVPGGDWRAPSPHPPGAGPGWRPVSLAAQPGPSLPPPSPCTNAGCGLRALSTKMFSQIKMSASFCMEFLINNCVKQFKKNVINL